MTNPSGPLYVDIQYKKAARRDLRFRIGVLFVRFGCWIASGYVGDIEVKERRR